jgi:hypothetical protein
MMGGGDDGEALKEAARLAKVRWKNGRTEVRKLRGRKEGSEGSEGKKRTKEAKEGRTGCEWREGRK